MIPARCPAHYPHPKGRTMKKLAITLAAALSLAACSQNAQNETAEAAKAATA